MTHQKITPAGAMRLHILQSGTIDCTIPTLLKTAQYVSKYPAGKNVSGWTEKNFEIYRVYAEHLQSLVSAVLPRGSDLNSFFKTYVNTNEKLKGIITDDLEDYEVFACLILIDMANNAAAISQAQEIFERRLKDMLEDFRCSLTEIRKDVTHIDLFSVVFEERAKVYNTLHAYYLDDYTTPPHLCDFLRHRIKFNAHRFRNSDLFWLMRLQFDLRSMFSGDTMLGEYMEDLVDQFPKHHPSDIAQILQGSSGDFGDDCYTELSRNGKKVFRTSRSNLLRILTNTPSWVEAKSTMFDFLLSEYKLRAGGPIA